MYSLLTFAKLTSPDLVFLSEPQIFTSDLTNCMSLFNGEYSWELNSEEKLDPDLAMTKSRATGGTMVLWKKSLDKYITVHQADLASFLPVIYSPPGSPVTAHIALYLPTSGRETDFIDAITELSNTIDDIYQKCEGCMVYIRGNGNVNKNNLQHLHFKL